MIVAVGGGKGGVGTSVVALNLGAALGAPVIDADLAMGDLPGGRGPDLHDVLAGRAKPIEAVRTVGSVSILPCGRSLASLRSCEPERLVETTDAVADEFGTVVIDCPSGLTADAGFALLAADAYVPVTEATPSAVAVARRERELARTLDAGIVRAVVNRVTGEPPIDAVRESLAAELVVVPESEPLAAAWDAGRPGTATAPDSTAAQRIETLAEAVVDARR